MRQTRKSVNLRVLGLLARDSVAVAVEFAAISGLTLEKRRRARCSSFTAVGVRSVRLGCRGRSWCSGPTRDCRAHAGRLLRCRPRLSRLPCGRPLHWLLGRCRSRGDSRRLREDLGLCDRRRWAGHRGGAAHCCADPARSEECYQAADADHCRSLRISEDRLTHTHAFDGPLLVLVVVRTRQKSSDRPTVVECGPVSAAVVRPLSVDEGPGLRCVRALAIRCLCHD